MATAAAAAPPTPIFEAPSAEAGSLLLSQPDVLATGELLTSFSTPQP